MIFTPNEIQRLFGIIDFRLAKIIADVLGVNQLTPEDKILLERNKVEWRKELGKVSPYYQAYLFGKLSGVLSPSQLQSIDYNDFSQYIERKQFKTLSNTEKAMFNAAATRSYAYIKSMGSRMKDIINNTISQEEIKLLTEQQRILEHTTIKKEMIEGVLKKKSIQSIVSDIGHSLEDWNRDWGRIVETEMQGIYQIGVAQQIMENYGAEALVYKEVYQQACSSCIHAYTTQGIGSKPRIFKLIDLIANGDNIGLKRKDWKPVLGPQHPFCYDEKTEVYTDQGWKLFTELNQTENFLSMNLENREVEFVKATRYVNQIYKGLMYCRKNKDIDLMTTPNHFHVCKTRSGIELIKEIDLYNCSLIALDFESEEKFGFKYIKSSKVKPTFKMYEGFICDVELEKYHTLFIRRNGKVCISGNCRCNLRHIPKGYVWDEELKTFIPPKDYKRKIQRESKVRIYVGDKEFIV